MNVKSSVLLVALLSSAAACSASSSKPATGEGSESLSKGKGASTACTPLPASAPGANPAAAYCVAMGYTLSGETCAFPDGTSCEEWAFFRGECGGAHSFCAKQGGTVANVTEDAGGWTASYAKCTLPSGATCQENAFAQSCTCN